METTDTINIITNNFLFRLIAKIEIVMKIKNSINIIIKIYLIINSILIT